MPNIKRIYNKDNVTQLIKEPTRTTDDTKTLIDHISTNKPTCISESGVIHCGISDHDVTYAIRRTKLPKSKKQSKNITVRKFNKLDEEAFIKDLKSKNFDQIRTLTDDLNEMWFIWKQFYVDVLNKHTPVANLTIKGNSLLYITAEARAMIKQRDYLRAKVNRTGSKVLRQAFTIRDTREKYYCKKIEENKGTWKILKQAVNKGNNATTCIDSIVHENQTITDKKFSMIILLILVRSLPIKLMKPT